MQIGSSTDWKKDIQHGRIHSMASKALFHTKTHVSSYSGQKNPKPLIPYLKALREKGIRCYIQYTINDYEQEGLETGVPFLEDRIRTFKSLVAILGKGAVLFFSPTE